MFEQALLDPTRQDRHPWAFAASTAGQSLALGGAILFSLIQTDTLPRSIFTPVPILAPRAAPRPVTPPVAQPAAALTRIPRTGAIFMPIAVPRTPPATILDPVDSGGAFAGALPYAGPGETGLPAGIIEGPAPPPPPPPKRDPPAPRQAKPPAPPPSKPVHVSSGVQAAKLIHQVKPVYPALARQARVSGTVRLEAIIGRDGAIRNLQLTGGHPLLSAAALEAVKQWRYQPTLLNGEPVEVVTQIDVNFTLQ